MPVVCLPMMSTECNDNDTRFLNIAFRAVRRTLPGACVVSNVSDVPTPSLLHGVAFRCLPVLEAVTTAPGLVLDMDDLGDPALGKAVEAKDVRHLAESCSRLRKLKLVLKAPVGVAGLALLDEHVAPHLAVVRRQVLDGPRDFPLPPLWRQPHVAVLFGGLRELSLTTHHSGLVDLCAGLDEVCPNLITLHLAVNTAALRSARRCDAVTVNAPASLRVLLVSLDDDAVLTHDDPAQQHFRLTVEAPYLATLQMQSQLRESSISVDGHLPVLRNLSLTVSGDWARSSDVWTSLALACPTLVELHLVSCSWDTFGDSAALEAWPGFVGVLAPLFGTLRSISLLFDSERDKTWGAGNEPVSELRRSLPPSVLLRVDPRLTESSRL